MILESLGWIATGLSIIGVTLNIQKKVACFYFWTIANFIWIYLSYIKNDPAQTLLFTVYLILSIWGIFSWKKQKEV